MHLSIELTQHELETLRCLAKDNGLEIQTGPCSQTGSIRQLMMAIAAGKLLLTLNPEAYQRLEGEYASWNR